MLLVADVGNTQTHLGVFALDGDEPAEHWRIATRRDLTADEIVVTLRNLLLLSGLEITDLDGVAISSVVPSLGLEYREMARRYLTADVVNIGPGVKTGMPIRIDNPHEVGADRLVNSVAAYRRFGRACVVVDFGTAMTFDAVSSAGEYLGGLISPGIEISLGALVSRAAKLPQIEIVAPPRLIGRSTEASIQSGIVNGFAAQVDGIVDRMREELGSDTAVVATGGLACVIVPHCRTVAETDDLLTLTGLRLIFEMN